MSTPGPAPAGSGRAGVGRGTLARSVAEAVASVPGVVRLSPGWGVPVATQHAGGAVTGVSLRGDTVAVHVVLDSFPVSSVAEPARSAAEWALRQLGDARPVEIVVDDIEVEGMGAGLGAEPDGGVVAAGLGAEAGAVDLGLDGEPLDRR